MRVRCRFGSPSDGDLIVCRINNYVAVEPEQALRDAVRGMGERHGSEDPEQDMLQIGRPGAIGD